MDGGGTYTYFSFCVSNLKMWTVSVLLEAERYRPSMLNANEQMLTHLKNKDRQVYRGAHVQLRKPCTHAETRRQRDVAQISYLLTPRRNSKSFCPSGMEKTRMTVPWEEVRDT